MHNPAFPTPLTAQVLHVRRRPRVVRLEVGPDLAAEAHLRDVHPGRAEVRREEPLVDRAPDGVAVRRAELLEDPAQVWSSLRATSRM